MPDDVFAFLRDDGGVCLARDAGWLAEAAEAEGWAGWVCRRDERRMHRGRRRFTLSVAATVGAPAAPFAAACVRASGPNDDYRPAGEGRAAP